MNTYTARMIDESAWYILDTVENVLIGEGGGPFPYHLKRVAAAAAARMNGRFGPRRYMPVTWLLERRTNPSHASPKPAGAGHP